MVGLPSFTSWRLNVPSVARGSVRVRYRWSWGSPFTTSAARGSAVRRVRVRLGNTASNRSVDGQLRPPTTQAERPCAKLQTGRQTRTRTTVRERDFCVVESSLTRLRRLFALFCHAAFSFTSSQGRHRHRSVCGDTKTGVAATRRICAIFRRGVRIAIDTCSHGCSTTKAIKAAPPLSGRTGDGASQRDSVKSVNSAATPRPRRT